ncbi:MAG: hypothetical protein O3A37_05280 [Planctomycetota bacterium]|jgi:hypothetical protein|nr:hypothetical protein [Planctomycetota bacterium]
MHRSPYLGTQIRSPQLTGSSDLAVARVVAVAWCLACSMICGTALATAQDPPVGEVTACYDDGTFDFSADTAALRIASAEKLATGPCADEADDCRDQLQKLRDDTISSIDLDIRVSGRPGNDYPCECRLEGETFKPRQFASTTFTWKAAGYCHKPLYFEHWNLERYGHSHGRLLDPFVSAAHFFVTLPVLPYKMGVELPWECVYPLGYYRPGSCAPWTCPAVPISARGFAVEAATVTGLVFLLP